MRFPASPCLRARPGCASQPSPGRREGQSKAMSEIRLSTFSILDHYAERPGSVGDRLQRGLELCELADELGYEACWVGEHHFSDFGVMPNPAVWLAAAAQRTGRIRLGPAVSVLPFRHPLQVVASAMAGSSYESKASAPMFRRYGATGRRFTWPPTELKPRTMLFKTGKSN